MRVDPQKFPKSGLELLSDNLGTEITMARLMPILRSKKAKLKI